MLAGCSQGEPALHLPSTWSDIATGTSTIELRPDGTGSAGNLPVAKTGPSCDPSMSSRVTGGIVWRFLSDDRLAVTIDNRDVIFWADYTFESPDWTKMMLGVCGEETDASHLIAFAGLPYGG